MLMPGVNRAFVKDLRMTKTRRIVLLGKTGFGKSSLANTIFGEDVFTVGHISTSETRECQAETRTVNGRSITLIDTPGLFDTDMPEENLKTEIVRCITECAPGPHAFLILLKVDKFTEQEKDVIRKICECFSEEAFKYAAVVFTQGDQLPEGITIEEFVSHNKCLSDVVKKCGSRCHVIDNKYWKIKQQDEYRSNQFQVAELLNTIDKIVMENKGGYYYFQAVPACSASHQQRRTEDWMKDRQRREQLRKLPQKSRVFAYVSQCRAEGPVQPSKNYSASLGPDETRRIVLLGRNGSGKSSLANTIFGDNVFTINHTLNSETKGCQAETRSVNGRSIMLIDTPGFFDTHMSEENLKPEIVRCITECAPGPHAFLILLKVDRFTRQENDVIRKICEYFSEEAFKYAAVVFTRGDQLEEGMTIEEFVSQNNHMSDLVKKCGGRCHVVDNKHWNNRPNEYRSNQFQVAELLNTIDNIVMENNGGCYTNEMLQTVYGLINKHLRSCNVF